MAWEFLKINDQDTLVGFVASNITDILESSLESSDEVGLIVAGGRTTPPILEILSNAALDWRRIRITLTDERWVDPGSDMSNERMVRAKLLKNKASSAQFTPLYTGHESPQLAEPECHQALLGFPWKKSICVLGMGVDGHIASLFPNVDYLDEALDPNGERLCRAMVSKNPNTSGAPARMTLTIAALGRTRRILLVITGHDKYRTLIEADHGHDLTTMPVRAVLHRLQIPVDVIWSP